MPELINIPDDVNCIHPYILTATITVATAIIVYLLKAIKEEKAHYKQSVFDRIKDLKDHSKNIELITQKDSNKDSDNQTTNYFI